MSLDVLSPRGQQSVLQEQEAIALFQTEFPAFKYVETPKDQPALVDALLMRNYLLDSVVETKCRDCSYDQFMTVFGGEWLVTFDKIVSARIVATSLGVGLTGFLYLTRDRVLLAQRITDNKGLVIPAMRIEATETKRTTNGGKIVRTNAFIDMRNAKVIRG